VINCCKAQLFIAYNASLIQVSAVLMDDLAHLGWQVIQLAVALAALQVKWVRKAIEGILAHLASLLLTERSACPDHLEYQVKTPESCRRYCSREVWIFHTKYKTKIHKLYPYWYKLILSYLLCGNLQVEDNSWYLYKIVVQHIRL